MVVRLVAGLITALVAATWTGACLFPFCDREGCEATAAAANASLQQGVAGAVSSASDACANGCCECPLVAASLAVFSTGTLATTSADIDAAVANDPVASIESQGRYEQALDAGAFVMCQVIGEEPPGPCAAFEVVADGVTTVNLRLVFGPPSFAVFDADGAEVNAETFRSGF